VNPNIASTLLLVAVSATPAFGQQPVLSDRVAKSQPTQYLAPDCGLKANHFKVSSGAAYLKSAVESDVPENRTRILNDGERVLLEAMNKNGQVKNPAAWYFLGRIYLQRGDIYGADSALTRAVALAPNCAKDVDGFRKNAWVALVKAGSKFEEEKNTDSALVMYRQAAVVYHGSPITNYQIAAILNDKGQVDSAAEYFGKAAAVPPTGGDTTEIKFRNRSAFNQGAILLNAKKYDAAAAAFQHYLAWVPNDNEAKRGLAASYRGLGQTEKAQALEKDLVNAGGAPGAGAGAGAGAASQDLMSAGVNLYNDKKYAEAATAFQKASDAEPFNRDALSNLSNTYLALKAGPKLLATATKLVAIEPLSENALKLQGEGYKESGKVDSAVKVAERVLALPVDVKVNDFTPTGNSATLSMTATGRPAQTPSGKPIAPVPVGLVVEFLDAKGGVVAPSEAQIPPLKPGASQEVKVTGQGAGITAWRYKKK